MKYQTKLNSVQAKNELVLWMVLGPILLILLFFTGLALLFLAPVFILYSLVSGLLFLRTLSTGYLVRCLLFFFLTIFTLLLFFMGKHVLTLVAAVLSALLLIWLVIMLLVREFKWRILQVLELAAQPVDEVREGYSMRPMPAGKLNYTWEQLLGFAGHLRQNLAAIVYYEKDKVIFGLSRNTLKMVTFSRDYLNDTWVAFDRDGHVSVHISREDHAQFRESYAFDQLCDSLGSVFTEFFHLHQQGRGQEILHKLDFIRLS
jgi:hypothetical protein